MKTVLLIISFMLIHHEIKAQSNSLVYKEVGERTEIYDSTSASWSFSDSESYSYDANAKHTGTTDFIYSSGMWNKNTLSSFSWDAKGNVINYLIQSWVSNLNAWRNESQFVNTFNAAGDQISSLSQQWNIASSAWISYAGHKYQKIFNTSNEIIDEVDQSLNSSTQTWENKYHYITTYGSNGFRDTTITQVWNFNSWQNFGKETFTYDKNNYLTEILYQAWDSAAGIWSNPSRRYVNTYDADGNLLTKADYVWNSSTSTWDPSMNRYTYTYIDNHHTTSELIEIWDTVAKKYYISSSIIQSYDINGNNTSYESSGGRDTYGYDANNNKTYFLNENYNPANHTFTPIRRTYYYYQAFTINSLNETKNESDVSLYPNPTSGNITVHNAQENIQHVRVRNILGENILELIKPNASEFSLDLSKYPAGIYVVTFATLTSVIMKKIIRE